MIKLLNFVVRIGTIRIFAAFIIHVWTLRMLIDLEVRSAVIHGTMIEETETLIMGVYIIFSLHYLGHGLVLKVLRSKRKNSLKFSM